MNRILFDSMVRICKTYWRALVAFLVAGISQVLIGIYTIVLFQRLIDSIPQARQLSDLARPLIAYGAFTLVNHLLIYLEGYPRSILFNGSYNWIKIRALKKVSMIDYLAYQDLGTGQIVQLIENGATAMRDILNGFYLAIIRSFLPQIVIALVLVRQYDHTLFAIFLGLVLVLSIVASFLMRALRRQVDRMLAHQERFAKFSVRGFMELVVFRVNNRFARELERVRLISGDIVRSRAKIRLVQELLFTGFAILSFFLALGVIVQQAQLITAGASTIGSLVALTSLIGQVVAPISHFSVAFTTYKQDRIAFRRFADFLALPDDRNLYKGANLIVTDGTIRFKDVSFSYDHQMVLHDLCLTMEGRQTTALVGVSGAGKSTLVRLLLHLIKPDRGEILVDGQDLSDIALDSYYRQVAYIPQEPPVFDGTIRENIVFDETISEEVLMDVIEKSGLGLFITRLPEGPDTLVGERGIKLSGGERQRLAFARLLVQQPKIVVMDEPTSALDSLTEESVNRHLKEFLTGRTVIVIAHRLQTVQGADRILVLDEGLVVQDGDFGSLVSVDGLFREMWSAQAG